jgi:hypothetical protein
MSGTHLAVYAYVAAGALLWGYGIWLWSAYRPACRPVHVARRIRNGAKS